MSVAQDQQRLSALEKGNERRGERARVRRQIARGKIDWRMVILDPPDCVAGLLLTEVLMLLPWMGRRRIERLGMLAHEFGLTLTVRAGKASRSTRVWVATHALAYGSREANGDD